MSFKGPNFKNDIFLFISECELDVNSMASTLSSPFYPISTTKFAAPVPCVYNLRVPDMKSIMALSFTSVMFNKAELVITDGVNVSAVINGIYMISIVDCFLRIWYL